MLETICHKVCELTSTVGDFVRAESSKINLALAESKGKNDFVTYVDKASEKLLVEGLNKLLPEAGFIAEEKTSEIRGKVYNWVIDPLDGTTNYIHGLPFYAISIGLLRDNIPVMGVVNELNFKECFYAWEGSKAYCNKTEIRVTETVQLKDSLIATGFPYSNYEHFDQYMDLLRDLMKKSHGLRRLGSAATDLAYVACGRFDAFYEYGLQPWDVAGGSVIVAQAGGKLSDFKAGTDYVFGKEIVSCTPGIYNEFLHCISEHF